MKMKVIEERDGNSSESLEWKCEQCYYNKGYVDFSEKN